MRRLARVCGLGGIEFFVNEIQPVLTIEIQEKKPHLSVAFSQFVKELKMSGSEARAKWVKSGETEIALGETQTSPSPKGQLFKIHSSKLKPHPARNPGQTSMVCIAQAMPFLCVSKDSFNGLFPQGVKLLAQLCFPKLLHEIKGFLPDMCAKDTLAFLVGAAGLPAGAIFAELRRAAVGTFPIFAGRGMSQLLTLGASKTVMFWIVGEIPRTKLVFLSFVSGIGKDGDPAVF